MIANRQILIADLPKARLGPEHFRQVETAMPTVSDGEVLLSVRYAMVDAAMRAWMLGPTYRAALAAGDLKQSDPDGATVVTRACAPAVAPGDLVYTDARRLRRTLSYCRLTG